MAKSYDLVAGDQFLRACSDSSRLKGAHVWRKSKNYRWWLEVIDTKGAARESFAVRFFDDPSPIEIAMRPELYSIDATGSRFSW